MRIKVFLAGVVFGVVAAAAPGAARSAPLASGLSAPISAPRADRDEVPAPRLASASVSQALDWPTRSPFETETRVIYIILKSAEDERPAQVKTS